jgi:hypothetical protein
MSRGHHAKKTELEQRRRSRAERKAERKRAKRQSKRIADVILTPEGMPGPAPTPNAVTIV